MNFNPRSPHGERQTATKKEEENHDNFNPRSPHGERRRAASRRQSGQQFQSTLPARGATLLCPEAADKQSFQSTLPARGATSLVVVVDVPVRISIHAPRTGSDYT